MSAHSSRRYLSVWLRRLPTDRMTRGCSSAPGDAPVVVVHMVKSARKLVAMFQENFVKYEQHVDADVRAAAPEVQVAAE